MAVVHTHGPGGDRSHGETAFTLWLDPLLALEQARAIEAALSRARPAEAEGFRAGLESLESELRDLDARFARVAERIGGAPLLFSHPVYEYFVHRYGLNGRTLHWEPDVAPDTDAWAELTALRGEHRAAWMIWEDVPLSQTRERLAADGVGAIVLAPTANPSGEDTFLAAFGRAAADLERAFPGP